MERIRRFIRELSEHQWLEQVELNDWTIDRSTYVLPGQYEGIAPYPEGNDYSRFPSKQGTTYFFRKSLELPAGWAGSGGIGLIFDSGGEGLLRVNGASAQGIDRNHTFVTLSESMAGGDGRLELEIEMYDPIPEPVDPLNQQAVIQPPMTSIRSLLVRVNRPVQSLMYTATVVRDSMLLIPEQDGRRSRLMAALYEAMDAFVSLDERQWSLPVTGAVAAIEERLRAEVQRIGGNAEGLMHMVGQSHIDIAWLWPARETVRKTSRTFSTVDALMNEYPQYRFTQSQPLLFEYLKLNDPKLYERVKARIREGRWELVGGMWVEPDLNIPSGESFMRQMLYGQRFYREEFGITSEIEWLPDTFGYCASLPQILKHGGIRYFMTTKLGWNDTNVFPYDLFHWVGIDGTPMLSYLNHGVNENTLPKDVHDHWQSYREKDKHAEQMLLFGHGDGGGGATREMLEYIDRAELMVGQPASRYSTAADFFAGTDEASSSLPKWRGDLYLELHRGTYTTHGRNKLYNRKAEILYREAELWQSLAYAGGNKARLDSVKSQLHEGWKLILLNQFHDIIPGSAITEAYETSTKEYEQVFAKGRAGLQAGLEELTAGIGAGGAAGESLAVFNSLGWSRDVMLQLADAASDLQAYDSNGVKLSMDRMTEDGSAVIRVPNVPALGYKTIGLKREGTAVAAAAAHAPLEDRWETELYLITFNERGEIASLFDKQAGREVLKNGETGNRFDFFHDRPTLWDAWDIDDRYEQQPAGDAVLLGKEVVLTGETMDVLRFRWRIGQSDISQDMILYRDDKRIDFVTKVNWNEAHKLLKVAFPVDIVTDKATYEIPFGALERVTHRNTSWEQAQYEVCGHRFADVSERGYGVSLLNDSKYGYDIQDSVIRLSLLRAPKWPDVTADLGEHAFTYSLYPHEGDWREAHTLRKAAELNGEAVSVSLAESPAVSEKSYISFDGEHVVVDTVKPAEDGDGIVIRLYESSGGRESVTLGWPHAFSQARVSNALEEELESIVTEDGLITLHFAPYEIKTIKLTF